MIGLKTQNNTCREALLTILSAFPIQVWQHDTSYEAVLTTDTVSDIPDPVISLGVHCVGEYAHIPTPIAPADLIHKIQSLLCRLQSSAGFENAVFLFQPTHRTLLLKENNTTVQLTEKESDLLSSLVRAHPNPMTRESLLESVWKYRSDTETHTVESHIYALRQKLGPRADALIKSTPAGYILVDS